MRGRNGGGGIEGRVRLKVKRGQWEREWKVNARMRVKRSVGARVRVCASVMLTERRRYDEGEQRRKRSVDVRVRPQVGREQEVRTRGASE